MEKTYYALIDDSEYQVEEILVFNKADNYENKKEIQDYIYKLREEFSEAEDNNLLDELGYYYSGEYVLEGLKQKYDCEVIPWDNSNRLYY